MLNRRRFLHYLGGLSLSPASLLGASSKLEDRYDFSGFGNATLLHFTDSHAQLLPVYYREPTTNVGIGQTKSMPPHLVGRQFLAYFGIKAGSREAYAFSHLDFVEAATLYGKMGGYAHLATLIKQIRKARGHENTLLLDGGDSWQGSATALWSQGQDMIAVSNQLGVDMMTGHWEFTYGSEQVLKNTQLFNGEFLAQNISLSDEAQFAADTESAAVFKAYRIKSFKNARVAIIGQAFPYTPIAHPQRLTPDWRFGIQERNLQKLIEQIKQSEEADVIVLLSHNGLDVDFKLASRVSGIDIILGGHTHDAMPRPIPVKNAGGRTWVSNAGSHGKFLAQVDLDIANGCLRDLRYRLHPVFSNLIEPDAEMQELINAIRAPYISRLQQPLGTADQLLYRRDTYKGTFDELILAAILKTNEAQIALSPGFRWGTTLLPGHTIRFEDVMAHTAITYPETYVRAMRGSELKAVLEDVADNLFNKDPYYRQGGDMVRVGGLWFFCKPEALAGERISQMRLANGELIEASKQYKVSGWASVGDQANGRSIVEVLVHYLKESASG
jgi:S-sulfosulfanyl-L-cysteine sulfohydrolase